MFGAGIRVYTTCPQSKDVPEDYLADVMQVSQWSEAAGCSGMLIYSDNSIVDPWLVTQTVLQATRTLAPLEMAVPFPGGYAIPIPWPRWSPPLASCTVVPSP